MYAVSSRFTDSGIAERNLQRRVAEIKQQRQARVLAHQAELDRLARIEERQKDALIRTQAARAVREHEGLRFRRSYADIEATALRIFKMKRSELRSNRRSREVAFARQFVMYWTARLTPLSLPVIGRLMGRDHTTILSGKRAYVRKRAVMGRQLREAR